MPGDARQKAIEAMERPGATFMMAPRELDALLDTIPPQVLARLAIERGGMVQVGAVEWKSRLPFALGADPVITGDDDAAIGSLTTGQPVYRLTEEAQSDGDRVDAAWVMSRAPQSIRGRVAEGWRPVMHECVEVPQWNRDGNATEDLTAAEVAWFREEAVTSG